MVEQGFRVTRVVILSSITKEWGWSNQNKPYWNYYENKEVH